MIQHIPGREAQRQVILLSALRAEHAGGRTATRHRARRGPRAPDAANPRHTATPRKSRFPARPEGPRPRHAQIQIHLRRAARVVPFDGGHARTGSEIEAAETAGIEKAATAAIGCAESRDQRRPLGGERVAIAVMSRGDVVGRAGAGEQERADAQLPRQRQAGSDQEALPHIGESGRSPLGVKIVGIGRLALGIGAAVAKRVEAEQEHLLVIHIGADSDLV